MIARITIAVLIGGLSSSARADEPLPAPPAQPPLATPPQPALASPQQRAPALAQPSPAPLAATSDDQLPQFAVAGPAGFGVVSADGASMLATHWLLQSDYRAFLDRDPPTPDRGTFALRFAGLRLDAIPDLLTYPSAELSGSQAAIA